MPVGPEAHRVAEREPKTVVHPSDMKLCIMIVSTFLRCDQAAVKKRESRRHQHDEARAEQHESGVADIDRHRRSIHGPPN